MTQSNKVCPYCKELGHSGFYCKSPLKPRKIKKVVRAKIAPATKKKLIKKKSRSYYVKKLDSVFSQYIRRSSADKDGNTTCVTCGDVKHWKLHQNGHYESRGHLPTRWAEDNCAPQCVGCNIFKKGNYTEYAIYMINKYGADKLIDLKIRANSNTKVTTVEIQEMIDKYTLL